MDLKFRQAVESLHPNYERLRALAPYVRGAELPVKGVYLFCENGEPIYVGRSDNIPRRFHDHRSSQTNKAALARLIACDELKIDTDHGGGREKYKGCPGFSEAFERARKRIYMMEFRAIEEDNPIRQLLLEVYCAVAANTLRFNKFHNH